MSGTDEAVQRTNQLPVNAFVEDSFKAEHAVYVSVNSVFLRVDIERSDISVVILRCSGIGIDQTCEWSLPGGYLHPDEQVEEAGRREMLEETGIDLSEIPYHFLGEATEPCRASGKRVFGKYYWAYTTDMAIAVSAPQPGSDGEDPQWISLRKLWLPTLRPSDGIRLGFEGPQMVELAVDTLRSHQQRLGVEAGPVNQIIDSLGE